MLHIPRPTRRTRTGCSVLALATVLVVGASPASAQSFQGSGSFFSNGGPGASITTAPNTTNIAVNPGQTVIDWSPSDTGSGGGTINFQPAGTVANFVGSGNYAVLNRINPADSSRAIGLNGTINTLALGAAAAANGSLYFYTPGGFVIGNGAIINVGSLVLSASPIALDASNNFIIGASNTVTFGQAIRPTASIITSTTSQINATAADAYVAMVAPRVQHGGSINVAGSAALVGAEAATISFSPDGLFDIQVSTGTTDANGVVSNGTITGAVSTGAADIHRAYLVAVPKNAALTMAITQGGSLGFNIAGAANVVGNTVVLSAGHNITDGAIESAPTAAGNGFKSNLSITGATMTSALVAAASGTANIFSPVGQSSNFASNVTMRGVDQARVGASGFTTTVNIAGNLDLSTATTATASGQDVTSGTIEVYAQQNASVTVTGSTTLDSNAYGGSSSTANLAGGDATGGDINIFAQTGGDINFNGGLSSTANGYGGYAAALNAPGGAGTGGDVVFSASGDGSNVNVIGSLTLAANGFGGSGSGLECFNCDGDGGVGSGGTVDVFAVAGGDLNLGAGGVSISTNGVGGYSGQSNGGSAFGNSLTRIYADGVGSSVTSSGVTTITSNATGGNANNGAGGGVEGGDIDIFAQNGGTMLFGNTLTASADGIGGAGAFGGGTAFGGSVSIFSTASLTIDGTLNASADAFGGLQYFTNTGGNFAGDAFGGYVDVWAQNGLLTIVGAATLSTNARGGEVSHPADQAGDGIGGTTRLFANAGGTIDLQSTLDISAIGTGGGSAYYGGGIGGNGLGGAVRVQATAADATITIADAATLDASGNGSDNRGGIGTGGTAWADSFGASTAKLEFLSDVSVYAQGNGGGHNNGNGGSGQGGEALLQASAGSTLTVGGNATVNSDAFGGYSYDFSDGIGGNAVGGTARIQAFAGTGTPGTIDIEGSATVSANGRGGTSYSYFGGTGGDGTGGLAQLYALPGMITIGSAQTGGGVTVTADGAGGNAQGGTGGDGTGGTRAEIAAINGDITIAGYALVSASGTGGNGDVGGDGLGSGDTSNANIALWTGGAHIFARNGDIVIGGGAGVYATGNGGDASNTINGNGGGDGGDGGDGTGGWATISAANSGLGPSLIRIVGGPIEASGIATVSTNGTGGDGGNGYEGDYGSYGGDGANGINGANGGVGGDGGTGGNGGNGGNGVGGRSTITASADNGHVVITDAVAMAMAVGGVGGSGANGGTGGDGGAGGIAFEGSGGNGGNGGNGGLGGSGGSGGSAIGGIINVGTESGNGSALGLAQGDATYGTITLNASASGGSGGYAGSGGFGGFGGAAGTGIANGTAGTGGAEGATGNGGNGGDATGGGAVLLVRGSTVNVGSATLIANATGGNAGDGPGGTGGNATIGGEGGIGVLATERFLNVTQRGTLNAGTINGTSIAIAGLGETDGLSQSLGYNGFIFRNADGYIDAVDVMVQADSIVPGSRPDEISVNDGEVIVDGSFSWVTTNNLSLFLDNGDFTADAITWHATDFVPDVDNGTPDLAGTFFARVFDIQTGNNFVTTAHLDSIETLSIVAPGAIQIGNVTGDADIVLNAQGAEVDIGNVLGGGGIDIDADDFIFAGNLTGNGVIDLDAGSSIQTGSIVNNGNTSLNAGSSINVGSINSGSGSVTLVSNNSGGIYGSFVVGGSIYADSDGDLFLGNLTAPGDIELYAVSDMMIGNATAGETIDLEAGGYVDGGTMTAGDSVYVEAGDYVDLLNISAGIVDQSFTEGVEYNVGILSGGTIETGDIAAANSIGLGALDDIYTGSIDAENIFLALGGGDMSFGEINSGGTTYLADDGMIALGGNPSEGDFDPAPILAATPVVSGGSITLRGAVTTGKFVAAASGAISGSTIDSDTSIYTSNGGNVTLTDLDAGTSIFQRSSGIITENDLTAGTFIDIRSGGGLALGALVAGDYIDLRSTGAIGLGNATAGETINFLSGSTLTGANMTAGNEVLAETMGAIQLGNVTAGITDPSVVPGAQYAARFSSGGAITIGNVNALGRIGFGTPTNLLTGNLTSGNGLSALVGGDMSLGTINVDDYVYLANYSMSALGGTFATFDLTPILASTPVATGGSITLRGPVTADSFTAAAGTFVDGGNVSVDRNIFITAGTDITLDALVAGSVGAGQDAIRFDAGGLIKFDNATAIGGIDLEAVGSITGDDLTSGQGIHAEAGGAIEFESLSAGLINPQANDPDDDVAIGIRSLTSIGVGSVDSAESVGFVSLGSLDTGPITTGGDVIALAGGYIELGTVNAGGRVYLANASIYQALEDLVGEEDVSAEDIFNSTLVATGGSILTGPITAGRLQAAAGTTMWIDGDIDSDTSVDLSSGGTMQLENVTAGSTIRLTSGATIDGGNLTAGSDVRVAAVGAIDVGNITIVSGSEVAAGFTTQDVGPGTPVELFGASITTGNISTDGYVGLYTSGDLQVGTIIAGHDVIALVGDDATFGAIATPERFFLGGYEMYALVTGGEGFNPGAVFDAATKSATDGSATFAGSSSASSFEAYVGDDTTLASLATDPFAALIDTGGLFTLTGTFTGGRVISNDIDIGANALITDDVELISRNSAGTLIGDGLTGNGYRLSDAEVDRIHAAFRIGADVGRGADDLMIIGDLSITRNANDPGDEYGFLVGNESTETELGTIRIVGDVTFNNLLNQELVYFTSKTFELDAATGSISLYGQGTTLGGRLSIESDQVWVASETILAKLRANPLYADRVAELNAPATVQRPEGVIRAEAIEFGEDEPPSSLLVQNTGTTATPAGFLLNAASIGSDEEGGVIPAGSIDLVINGQVITEGGTVTGIAVRDGLVTEFGTEAFVAGSTINGCVLVGPCIATNPRPPVVDTVKPTDVQLAGGEGLGDGLFGNEPDIDDGESGDEGDTSSPITAPVPLFDSRPLTASDDVDDPVSGAGNPSLYGNPADDEAAQCDGSKDASCKTGKKGDGK